MITPNEYPCYSDYLLACKAENEVPADEYTWRSWCRPPLADDEPTTEQRIATLERQVKILMNKFEDDGR